MRAYGQFGIKISDSRNFLTEIIGVLSNNDLVNHSVVTKYFKGFLATKIKDVLANIIVKDRLSIFDITASIDLISSTCKVRVSKEFERFGLEVVNLFIESVNIPLNDVLKLKTLLEKKAEFTQIGDERYLIMRQLDVLEKLANNPGEGGAGMDIGAGLGAGIASGKILGEMFSEMGSNSAQIKSSSKVKCSN